MVESLIQHPYKEFPFEFASERYPPTGQLPGNAYLFPAILTQLADSAACSGAAFVRYFPASNEVSFEYVSGLWKDYAGSHFPAREDVADLFIHAGQITDGNRGKSVGFDLFKEIPTTIKSIVFTPIATTRMSIEALWVVRDYPFNEFETRHILELGDALANIIYLSDGGTRQKMGLEEKGRAFSHLLFVCDPPTYHHSTRLVPWVEATSRLMGVKGSETVKIRWGTLLHDFGKIAIPKKIIYKPAEFTPEEWAVMKQHPELGARILKSYLGLHSVAEIVQTHHEKYDGSGYPAGMIGEEIPLAARILSVVDAYGAMTEDRVYRKTCGHASAVAEIKRCAGTDFDPRVCDAFLRLF
jgi:putative nucleotidyltransferase with HDIG domain